MALKDWKKDRVDDYWTRYNPNGTFLYATQKINITYGRFLKKWLVSKEDGSKPKMFKTKSQALKFAKSYMRKN